MTSARGRPPDGKRSPPTGQEGGRREHQRRQQHTTRASAAHGYLDPRDEITHLRLLARDAEATAAAWLREDALDRVDGLLAYARQLRRRVRQIECQIGGAA